LQNIHDLARPLAGIGLHHYQVTNELRAHTKIFPRLESEYCLQNIPPMFVIKFYKQALNGSSNGNGNGNGTKASSPRNGNGAHKH